MKDRRLITIFFTKSYVLCLTIVLVGCIPATTPRISRTATDTSLPSLSVCVPIETPQSFESKTRFFVDRQRIVNRPHESIDPLLNKVGQDVVLAEGYNPSLLSTFSYHSTCHPIDTGKEQTHWLFVQPDRFDELRNVPDGFDDSSYLTISLQNSGGGGSGGRRKTPEME